MPGDWQKATTVSIHKEYGVKYECGNCTDYNTECTTKGVKFKREEIAMHRIIKEFLTSTIIAKMPIKTR